MKKLNNILHCKRFYLILIGITFLYSVFYFSIPKNSKLDVTSNSYLGMITAIKLEGDLLTLRLSGKEKIVASYYFKSQQELIDFYNTYQLGDTVQLTGTYQLPSNNTVPNLFNYRKYLERQQIYYLFQIERIEKQRNNQNLFYIVKNHIHHYLSTFQSKAYLYTFLLGNKEYIDSKVITSYQENGISHLFAISGMHISLLSALLLKILGRLKCPKTLAYIIVSIFLVFFFFLSGCSISVSRSVLFFILMAISSILHFNLGMMSIWILTCCMMILYHPEMVYEVSFQYSFGISFALILLSSRFQNMSYGRSLFWVSLTSFFVSVPISITSFYQINFLSIIWNLIFVPFVSMILFPLSLLTFFLPFLDSIFMIFIHVLETSSLWCSHLSIGKVILGIPHSNWIMLYYFCLVISLYFRKKVGFFCLGILFLFQYFELFIMPRSFMIIVDVGQGDSILLHSNYRTVLIDTGGKIPISKEEWQKRETKSIADTKIIPLLKSLGIKKLDSLVLTHGDYDHMGEAKNLINHFKVEYVVFNTGEYNDLELALIKVLDEKNIPYDQNIKFLNMNKIPLYFLNTKDYHNENENSSVIYTEINNTRVLLMGDAGVERETDILKKYDIKDIDILKVGHHGSKTSSSKTFIEELDPKYSLISVGKSNRYGHPNKEVLSDLENSMVYRTDIHGSICFQWTKNQLEIRTWKP